MLETEKGFFKLGPKAQKKLNLSDEEKKLISDHSNKIVSLSYGSLFDNKYNETDPKRRDWKKIADETYPEAPPLVKKVLSEMKKIEEAKSPKP